ncbi:hypothetical protein HAX54_009510, partial [Datura stramonium]|nr:hypothetical protein [Datura stramonium]
VYKEESSFRRTDRLLVHTLHFGFCAPTLHPLSDGPFLEKTVHPLHRTLGFKFCLSQVCPSINGLIFRKMIRPSNCTVKTPLAWFLKFVVGNRQ